MRLLVPLALLLVFATSCKKDPIQRTVEMGVFCDSCLVRWSTSEGGSGTFISDYDTAFTQVLEDGATYRMDACNLKFPITLPGDTAVLLWAKVDGTPSGYLLNNTDSCSSLVRTVQEVK